MKKAVVIFISAALLLVAGCVYYPYSGTPYVDSAYYAYPAYSLSFRAHYPYSYYPYYYPYSHPYYYGYSHPGGSRGPGPYYRR